ncbi:MAG: nucleoside hydrolase [Erysipelotrichaceae bacterium]|jgi:pyrimidine-specific ribonucleoside hydrolase|nr:nucleoside hydrolase [Erysipelotrichaceae bacterium]
MKILIDCDTGGDDAAAITLALASSDLEVLGISTCLGNLELAQTTRNTQLLLAELQACVDLCAGSDVPLVRQKWVGNPNGKDLLETDKELTPPVGLDLLSFYHQKLAGASEPVTLVPLAPLTNIAKVILAYPDLVREKVERIVLMGGGIASGNTTGAAELNFYADPEAAQIVFGFDVPVVLCGLDVCHKAVITQEAGQRYFSYQNKYAKMLQYLLKRSWSYRQHGSFNGSILYDTIPVLYLLYPQIFTGLKGTISIETASALCTGATLLSVRKNDGDDLYDKDKQHQAIMDLDLQLYLDKIEAILAKAEEQA